MKRAGETIEVANERVKVGRAAARGSVVVASEHGVPNGWRVFANRCGGVPVHDDVVHVVGLVRTLTDVMVEPERGMQSDRSKGSKVAGGESLGCPAKDLAASELDCIGTTGIAWARRNGRMRNCTGQRTDPLLWTSLML